MSVPSRKQKPTEDGSPYIYEVEFENGLLGELPETELIPMKLEKPRDPLDVMATLQHDEYLIFSAREGLNQAYSDLLRRCAGASKSSVKSHRSSPSPSLRSRNRDS